MIIENDFFKEREVFIEEYQGENGGVLKLRIEAPETPEEGWRYARKRAGDTHERGAQNNQKEAR